MNFKSPNLPFLEAIKKFKKNPEELMNLFREESLLIGLLITKDSKNLVLSENENFKALACFTNENKLLEFSPLARPSILHGKEIAQLANTSSTKLLHLDPPDGPVVLGSMLRAIITNEKWVDSSQSEILNSFIQDQIGHHHEVSFYLERGEWTDLKIALTGEFKICAEVASKLGQLLAKDPTVIELLPSGADIVYLS